MSTTIEPLFYSISDAGRRLGIGRSSIYELCATGALVAFKIAGAKTVITAESIAAYAASLSRAKIGGAA